jgi:hypothetical protein
MPKNKTMHEGAANKERQEGKCERLGCCGMENSSWEGREGRGPEGKEGEEEENDGGREKNRRAEERTRGGGGKEESRGNARVGGERVSRKGERRRRR